MKKNVTGKLTAALLFFWLSTPGNASPSSSTLEILYIPPDVEIIPIYDISGHAMDITPGNRDCLTDTSDVKHCLLELTTKPANNQRTIYPEPLQRLDKSTIRMFSSISTSAMGSLTVLKGLPIEGSSLSYYADFSKTIVWIEKAPILTSLMIALHPALLEQVLNHLESGSHENTRLADQYVFKVTPKPIPIPEKYENQISDDIQDQILMIDLGDHYTMLVRLAPLKIYIGDRLGSTKRALRNYLAYAHAGLNLFEMFMHTWEFGNYGIELTDMITQKTYQKIPMAAVGMPLHFLETQDHYRQVQKSINSHLLLEEEEESYFERAIEIAHPFHSAYEFGYAYMNPHEFTKFHMGLRYLSLGLTMTNLIKDQIPQDWSESYPDQLLEVFMKNEFDITLVEKVKDEI